MLKRALLSLVLFGVLLVPFSPAPVLSQTYDAIIDRDRDKPPESQRRRPGGPAKRQSQSRVRPSEPLPFDIRGQWVGNAKGKIFGAEGSVVITQQQGEDIRGIVEGSNFLGKARFSIDGKIQGGQIFGSKEGHTFQGQLYADGTIRGLFRASDGDEYRIFLQRTYPQWGMQYPSTPYQDRSYQQAPYSGHPHQPAPQESYPYQGMPYQGTPYQDRQYPGAASPRMW